MPVMTLMLLASVLPLRFPLLNLCVRDRNDALCQAFESLEWRFDCRRDLGRFHAKKYITQDLERNAYNNQPPSAAIIKFPKPNLPQSIV